MANDNTLIYRAQTGDEGAFTDLMREYYPFVYTIVIGIVDNPHDVEEVVQDTFFNAYRGLTQLEDAVKFKGWLAEIARNCVRQWLRKQRGKTISLDKVSEDILQTEDSPDKQLIRQEQRELIRRTMETLPQKDRDIAHAFYLEGASYNELTSTHGLSDKAISFRLSRARQRLSKRLQYLLTSIFVSPGLTLKKLYSGGSATMKFGVALIVLIFIGYIGLRQMNAPTVEERVYLSPWEERTVRPQNHPEGFLADTGQDTESRNNLPQIASTSTAGTEPIDDFFDQLDEVDMTQFATETEFALDTVQGFTTDIFASSENTGQSAEDVMYAYLEAWRNSDFKVIDSLRTEQYRRRIHDNSGDGGSINESDEPRDEGTETMRQMLSEAVRKLRKQTLLVSSGYASNEFHFQLKIPNSELQRISDQVGSMFIGSCMSNQQVKMRKENGVWRIYVVLFNHESG